MSEKTIKPLQVLVEGFNLREIIKEDFLDDLQKQFDSEIKMVNLIFSVNDDEKRRLIALSHVRIGDEEKNMLVVDAPTSDNLNRTIEAIKNYGE